MVSGYGSAVVKRRGWRRVVVLAAVVLVPFAALAELPGYGEWMAQGVGRRCEAGARVQVVTNVTVGGLSWVEVRLFDEEYPLTLDFVVERGRLPRRVLYMLPVSGANFASSFFAPGGENMAGFFCTNGYLVVGITPREDNVPRDVPLDFMAGWGLRKHRTDVRKVVAALQSFMPLPYDMLGYSFSGMVALDYAASYADGPKKLMVMDIYSIDPVNEVVLAGEAGRLCDGYRELIGAGVYADESLSDLLLLLEAARQYPMMDSGISRGAFGLPLEGNFTMEALLHFWVIFSAYLPGVHSHLTGLPRDWPLVLSTFAGAYQPEVDPLEDRYRLWFTDLGRLQGAVGRAGSGVIPLALLRDIAGVNACNGMYGIQWRRIRQKTVWLNMELGYGNLAYGARAIAAGGNRNVVLRVVPRYGNGDPVYGGSAGRDVWRYFLE